MRALCLGLILAVLSSNAAFAQRVDTRRNGVVVLAPHVATCSFNAIPALQLREYPLESSIAEIRLPVADAPADTHVELVIRYAREEGLPFGTRAELLRVRTLGAPSFRKLRIRAAGRDIALIDLDLGNRLRSGRMHAVDVHAEVPPGDAAALAALLQASEAAQVDLIDDSGRVVGRYHWDTHRLDEIPELLDLVHWGCTTPDRG